MQIEITKQGLINLIKGVRNFSHNLMPRLTEEGLGFWYGERHGWEWDVQGLVEKSEFDLVNLYNMIQVHNLGEVIIIKKP